MARIRSLKPEFWDDRKLARSTSRDARMLYMGLWGQADEHGRLNGDPLWLKGRIFPYDDDVQPDDVDALLDQLEDAGRVQRYEVDGDPYLFLPKLAKHQRLEPSKVESRLPEPPPITDESEPRMHPDATTSEPRADESAPAADESGLLYGSGSMDQGSGIRGQVVLARTSRADAFDEFWSVYPRHEGKIKARAAFEKAAKDVDASRIVAGAKRYADDPNRDPIYTAHPTTWLKRGSWDDDPLPARSSGPIKRTNDDKQRAGLALAQRLYEREREQEQRSNVPQIGA